MVAQGSLPYFAEGGGSANSRLLLQERIIKDVKSHWNVCFLFEQMTPSMSQPRLIPWRERGTNTKDTRRLLAILLFLLAMLLTL